MASFENLHAAWLKTQRGKLRRPDVARFSLRWETALLKLSEELTTGQYRPGAYRVFTVHEKKTRTIMAAPLRDRIVHHAVCNLVSPLLERSLVPGCCANRTGFGSREALRLFAKHARTFPFVLKADVRQFFPSIDRRILLDSLTRRIPDPGLLSLIGLILEQAPAPGMPGKGLPIGNMTSQVWANWYLSPLDHFVTDHKGYGAYVRYVDDCVVFAHDKGSLNGLLREMTEFVQSRLGLSLHANKSRVHRLSEGVPFLGFRNYPSHRVPGSRSVMRFKSRLRCFLRESAPDMEQFRACISGWCGHARNGNTWRMRQTLRLEFPLLQNQANIWD